MTPLTIGTEAYEAAEDFGSQVDTNQSIRDAEKDVLLVGTEEVLQGILGNEGSAKGDGLCSFLKLIM